MLFDTEPLLPIQQIQTNAGGLTIFLEKAFTTCLLYLKCLSSGNWFMINHTFSGHDGTKLALLLTGNRGKSWELTLKLCLTVSF